MKHKFYDLTPPPVDKSAEAIGQLQETMEDILVVLMGLTTNIKG